MSKKTLIIIGSAVLVLGLCVGGYFYWKSKNSNDANKDAIENAGNASEKISESASKGLLPDISGSNPLENKPDINPVDKTNPFTNIKTNPFE